MQEKIAALHPCPVNSHGHFRELVLDLQRLVTGESGAVVCKNLLKTAACPLVSPGEHGDVLVAPVCA